MYSVNNKMRIRKEEIVKNRLKEIRSDLKMTQEELAKAAGISRTTLAMIVNEKAVPDGITIAKLVEATHKPANEIFFALGVV